MVAGIRFARTVSFHHALWYGCSVVYSSCPCIKLIPCLFESSPPKRSLRRLFYQIYVTKLPWRSWLWLCFVTWKVLLEYIFRIFFVRRTTLKPGLWVLFLSGLTVGSTVLCSLSVKILFAPYFCTFSSSSPTYFTFFLSLLLSVSFQFSFQTSEILHCC